jgi:septal ring factor EnvC (AmiA/AmiB activator)
LSDERVRLLEARRLGLLVRKLRLVAQQNESPDFMVPQLIGFDANNFKVGMYYAAENEVFSSEMEAHRHQRDLLQKQQPRLEAEMTALTEQLANEQRRTSFIKSRVAELDDYKNKGLVRTYVLNEQQREEARAGAEVARLEAGIAGLQRQMGELEIRIEEANATYQRQLMNGLQETLQNLREIEVTLQTSRELRDYRADDAGMRDETAFKIIIMISRTGQQGPAIFKADYDTIVEPGDVIEVKRKIAQSTDRPASSNEASLRQ